MTSEFCTDKNMGVLLHAYELGMLSEKEKDAFEAHLLDCKFCFQQLKEFAPRGTTLTISPEIKKVLDEVHRQQASKDPLLQKLWRMLWPEGVPAVVKPAVLLCVLLLMIYPARLGHRDFDQRDIAEVQEIALLQARSSETFVVAPFKKHADGLDFKQFITTLDVHLDASEYPRLDLALQTRDSVMLKPDDILHLVFHIPYEHISDCRLVRIACT